ncbi:MAG: citrate/2-methylcitrate synthase [Deltaproteobacteria bacterium]|nr:citrate/2-methylcitrate synthase [Deltaproteobacteria bacterium]
MATAPQTQIPGYSPGLEDVIAGTSAISKVDPQGDELLYYGYKVSQLCEQSNFEEVSYLVLNGKLPTKTEFEAFNKKLVQERNVPEEILSYLCKMPEKAHYMDILRSGVSLMAHFDPQVEDNSKEAELNKSIKLIAKMPTLLAARIRALKGEKPVAPNAKLNHAANFLYMLTGKEPDADFAKALDVSLICYAEHGFNASTFTARVIASTLSDMHSCVTGAIGALKGPLHGGANEHAMYMLLKIGDPSKAEQWIRDALAKKEKIMGFGHRVYKKKDSRAPILKEWGWKMAKKLKQTKWHEMQEIVERVLMSEKKLFPNVDFPAATLYYLLDLPIEADTPLFVVARMSGWCAHIMEQRIGNRIMRPESIYTGPEPKDFVEMAKR